MSKENRKAQSQSLENKAKENATEQTGRVFAASYGRFFTLKNCV